VVVSTYIFIFKIKGSSSAFGLMEAQHAGRYALRGVFAWAFTVNCGNETFISVVFAEIKVLFFTYHNIKIGGIK
jgi:hypothetical protein